MDKTSSENIPCTYCSNDSIPGTYPPVCAECQHKKEASDDTEPATLKELESND